MGNSEDAAVDFVESWVSIASLRDDPSLCLGQLLGQRDSRRATQTEPRWLIEGKSKLS